MNSFTDAQLRAFASSHLAYETRMLVSQAAEFDSRYPLGLPSRNGMKVPVIDDALLEASLIHIRMLDGFFAHKKTFDEDVLASDFVPSTLWTPSHERLPAGVRKKINQQVAHLSIARAPAHEWRVREYAFGCCLELESLVRAVEKHRTALSSSFDDVRESLAAGLSRLAPEAKN